MKILLFVLLIIAVAFVNTSMGQDSEAYGDDPGLYILISKLSCGQFFSFQ